MNKATSTVRLGPLRKVNGIKEKEAWLLTEPCNRWANSGVAPPNMMMPWWMFPHAHQLQPGFPPAPMPHPVQMPGTSMAAAHAAPCVRAECVISTHSTHPGGVLNLSIAAAHMDPCAWKVCGWLWVLLQQCTGLFQST
eukprot:1153231-Pelagomonas_calceolata.AAC.6